MILNANDLTPIEKAALETLLGRCIRDGEAVSLRTFEQSTVSPQERHEIVDAFRKYFAEVDATRKPFTEGEREDAINEALRSIRPGYHPRQ